MIARHCPLLRVRGRGARPILLAICSILTTVLLPSLLTAGRPDTVSAFIECRNPTSLNRTDALVQLPIKEFTSELPGFMPYSCELMDGPHPVACQVEDRDCDGQPDFLVLNLDIKGGETKLLTLRSPALKATEPETPKRAQADLAVKTDYVLVNGEYTGGRFIGVQEARVPPGNRAHNAYFKYEGPGWESDLIAYRLYLDERNRIDIFGKRTIGVILRSVGVRDLVSSGQESYQSMLDWGRDMFKVGNSLGIGSFALWRDRRPVPVSVTDSIVCRILDDGPLVARVEICYFGWKTGDMSQNLVADLSIAGGSRLTHVSLNTSDPGTRYVTGLAKHPECRVLSEAAGTTLSWGYLGYYGAQTLTGDSLGTAIFFRHADVVELAEDSLNHLVVLRPERDCVHYAFAAAWEQEPEGIRDGRMFQEYCERVVRELSAPIVVTVREGQRPDGNGKR